MYHVVLEIPGIEKDRENHGVGVKKGFAGLHIYGCFLKWWYNQNGCFLMENPIKMVI